MELKKPLNEIGAGSSTQKHSCNSKSFVQCYNQFISFYNKRISRSDTPELSQKEKRNSKRKSERRSTNYSQKSDENNKKKINLKQSLISISDCSEDLHISQVITDSQFSQQEIQPNHQQEQSSNPPCLDQIESEEKDLVEKFHKIYQKPVIKIVMVIFLSVVPILNLILLAFIFFYLLLLIRISKTHQNNMMKLSGKNPLEFYPYAVFSQQICTEMQKDVFVIPPKNQSNSQDSQFTYNWKVMLEVDSIVKQKEKGTESLPLIVYNQKFYDSFHLFNKEKYQIAGWTILGGVLVAANSLMIVSILFL